MRNSQTKWVCGTNFSNFNKAFFLNHFFCFFILLCLFIFFASFNVQLHIEPHNNMPIQQIISHKFPNRMIGETGVDFVQPGVALITNGLEVKYQNTTNGSASRSSYRHYFLFTHRGIYGNHGKVIVCEFLLVI